MLCLNNHFCGTIGLGVAALGIKREVTNGMVDGLLNNFKQPDQL
jgi:hypothetical protein